MFRPVFLLIIFKKLMFCDAVKFLFSRSMTLLVAAFRGVAVSGAAFSASFGFIGTVIEVVGASIASVVGGVFTPIGTWLLLLWR
ncbi:hypothetical protein [Bartonella sp. OT172YNZD]|uniref:hypothetical protein n=1 Tax=Bartonella sp. OT172YNZD TaxID=3243572 RepID=UPI0035D0769C